jgi:hypothetical protein
MRHQRITTLLATLTLAGILAAPGEASAQDREDVAEAIRTSWEGYIRAFAEGRVDFIADSVYTTPSFHALPDGVVMLTSTAELRDLFASALASIREQGYDHSETRASTVCPLTDATAVLSVEYARYRSDGEVLSEGAGTYVFAKTPSGWRVLGQIGHAAERLLGCSGEV